MLDQFPKGPNVFDPKIPSAVGSHESLVQEGRDKAIEDKKFVQDLTNELMNRIITKLPPEVTDKLDVMGSLRDKIYNYINITYQNMMNRYLKTVEDEFLKKVRTFIDREENRQVARYTPREIVELLDKIAGPDKFHTGEIEKSIVNMYGHLHGHIQREITEIEEMTNALLRQKTDVGALVRGQNAYAIMKAVFRDNPYNPIHVYDVKVSINILENELISPIYHYQVPLSLIIKEAIQHRIIELIDKEIERINESLVEQGKAELDKTEIIFEKIRQIENFTSDDKDDENSTRYTILAKRFIDKIEGLRAEIPPDEYDPLNIRETIKKIFDIENIRNRGYNTAVNVLTSILDTSKLGYQYINNFKNARVCIIKEYEETDPEKLPHESYRIKLAYYDQNQLIKLREEYDKHFEAFEREVRRLWQLTYQYYLKNKRKYNIRDFDDLVLKYMPRDWAKEYFEANAENGGDEVKWQELGFMDPEDTIVEESNPHYIPETENLFRRIKFIKEILQKMHGAEKPLERVILEERIDFIMKRFSEFAYSINSHHIQPGLILELDVTTIKRKQFILKRLAEVINEFLFQLSKGFTDVAFAQYTRRRSTVRADIEQSFAIQEEKESVSELAYKSKESTAEEEKKEPQVKGKADVSPKKPVEKLEEL
jgi:hypothetical protein